MIVSSSAPVVRPVTQILSAQRLHKSSVGNANTIATTVLKRAEKSFERGIHAQLAAAAHVTLGGRSHQYYNSL